MKIKKYINVNYRIILILITVVILSIWIISVQITLPGKLNEEYIELDDGKLSYYDSHKGSPALIFIHGLRLSKYNWIKQKSYFENLGYRVILYDLRGHGSSKSFISTWNIEKNVQDFKILIDTLKIQHPIIIGHSFGGMIAQYFAYQYQEYISGLVLVSTSSEMNETDKENLIKKINISDHFQWILEEIPVLLTGHVLHDYFRCSKIGSRNSLKHCVEFKFRNEINSIETPTLIISGKQDKTINHRDSETLNHNIIKSRLVQLESVGHRPMHEETEYFNKTIHEYIVAVSDEI